jgi:hypothetical protein
MLKSIRGEVELVEIVAKSHFDRSLLAWFEAFM